MPDICLLIASDPLAVRGALQQILGELSQHAIDPDLRARTEIVLAEVLNNIVEHAYAEMAGEITLEIFIRPEGLQCHVRDSGAAMPGLELPAGLPRPITPENLPEGGFGWFMIRSLTRELRYARRGDCNELTFRLPEAT